MDVGRLLSTTFKVLAMGYRRYGRTGIKSGILLSDNDVRIFKGEVARGYVAIFVAPCLRQQDGHMSKENSLFGRLVQIRGRVNEHSLIENNVEKWILNYQITIYYIMKIFLKQTQSLRFYPDIETPSMKYRSKSTFLRIAMNFRYYILYRYCASCHFPPLQNADPM